MITIQKKEKKVVPVNVNYDDITAFGKQILIVGNNHLNKIRKNKLNNPLPKQNVLCVKSFSGVKIQDLKHYLTNNMSYNNLDTNASILAENKKVEKKCIYDLQEVVISSVFVKESIRISSLIGKVNDELSTTN